MLRNILIILSVILTSAGIKDNNITRADDYQLLLGFIHDALNIEKNIETVFKVSIENYYNKMIEVFENCTDRTSFQDFEYKYQENGTEATGTVRLSVQDLIDIVKALKNNKDSCIEKRLFDARKGFQNIKSKLLKTKESFVKNEIAENDRNKLIGEIQTKLHFLDSDLIRYNDSVKERASKLKEMEESLKNLNGNNTLIANQIFSFMKEYGLKDNILFKQKDQEYSYSFDPKKDFIKPELISNELWKNLENALKKTKKTYTSFQ